MKIASVVGTRPNFIKEYLIHSELKNRDINEIIIHTGQHYDYEMSKIFFEDFNLPEPDYHLNEIRSNSVEHISLMMNFAQNVLHKVKPEAIIVYGDVNSTLACSIAAAKLKIPVIHIEGGIRSNNIYNPEEINRRVTDSISSIVFAATKTDYDNLIKENFEKSRAKLVGDLMKDSLLLTMELNDISPVRKDYSVCTIHREENVESKSRLENIIKGLVASGSKIILPAHPRTSIKIKEHGLSNLLINSNVKLVEPKGYKEFIQLLSQANKVITDSGGVRRESYILGKPVVLLIDLIWFPEIHQAGWAYISDDNTEKIIDGIQNFEPSKDYRPEIFGNGLAHQKIANDIENYFV